MGRLKRIPPPGVRRVERREACTLDIETRRDGLRTVLIEQSHLHSAVAAVYVRSGARYETRENRGISHLLEHMVFRGTERFGDSLELCRHAESLGGPMDATTDFEYTTFWIHPRPERLPEAVELLGEAVTRPRLSRDDLSIEKRIVLQEQKDSVDSLRWDRDLARLIWPDSECSLHPLGDASSVERVSGETLRDWHSRTYSPASIVVAVAGAFEREEVRRAVKRAFPPGWKPVPGRGGRVRARTGRAATAPRARFRREDDGRFLISIFHRGPSYSDPDDVTLWVMGSLLGGGPTSRLFLAVRDEQGLAYDASTSYFLLRDEGFIEIRAGVREETALDALDIMARETARLASEGVDPDELESFRETVACRMESNLDRPDETASWYGVRALLVPERLEFMDEEAERVSKVTGDDVRGLAGRIFRSGRRYALLTTPASRRIREEMKRVIEGRWKA